MVTTNKFRLPKAFTEKWIEALKSGKYKQGTEFLERIEDIDDEGNKTSSYCCLGVAATLLDNPPYKIEDCNFIGEDDYDSVALKEWVEAGYPKELVYVREYLEENSFSKSLASLFSNLNDGTSKIRLELQFKDLKFPETVELRIESESETFSLSFEEIAEFIELNFELYE